LKGKNFQAALAEAARHIQKYPFQVVSSSVLLSLSARHELTPLQGLRLALENNILPETYLRNYPSMDMEQHIRLTDARVLLVGLGGLGGYVLEILARAGTGSFILADGDIFEESNLNRQLLGTVDTLEKSKVKAARSRLAKINPFCRCIATAGFLCRKDLPQILENADLVIDALGGIEFRSTLLQETSRAGLPLVTGFVAGTTGLACTVYPGGKSPSAFWQGKIQDGAEDSLGNMATIVSLIAALQANEALGILTGKKSGLADKVFLADLQTLTFDLLQL
jgi:molybdopterin-synthase adenylyltransferase